ncbi:hypothetical protein DYB37_006072 [Aphanomyces astaci]|uniref:PX domain-containing protein n=2 Tax=Aphanomyces astaci TaxID=112090 RepID=A0A397EU13_APHAT|nr:hypothetical protein DYB25_004033 [Aphanomyces astaci]RHY59542.1 hypothetical protein DYB34_005822 [Aphanomyces astaci]RHY79783.1 hypothetical protein DYB30_010190 [Aphanomyces astaci]RHY97344.1 hypothetical protein DYB35_010654 [Aphanomyces astaci]RHY97572.1 hypothetical protein DYB31_011612 [Aphanomyces astaci]
MAPVDRSNLSRSGVITSGADNTSSDGIVVFIPAALKRPSHTLYCICVKVDETPHGGGSAEWSVNRRYSQFLELRKQILQFLQRSPTCPGCQSMTRAVGAFPFPPKAFFRTNKLVRQRTKDLQTFVEIVIARTFSTAPKCVTCGIGTMNLVWPFFNRGAQYISRQSTHLPPTPHASRTAHHISPSSKSHAANKSKTKPEATSDCSTTDSVQDMNDYEVHRRTTHRIADAVSMDEYSADPVFLTCRSDHSSSTVATNDTSLVQLQYRSLKQDKAAFLLRSTSETTTEHESTTAMALSYLDGAEKCTDPRTSVATVEQALDEVIIADGHANTKEQKMFRLSTMWEAFELDDIQRDLVSTRTTKFGILV